MSSVDFWGRHQVAGYGHLVLPREPGLHEVRLRCWRPKGSRIDRMRDFFLGGARHLKGLGEVGIPDTVSGGFANKYGLETETTGYVHLRIHVVINRFAPDHEDSGDIEAAAHTHAAQQQQMRRTVSDILGNLKGLGSR